MWCPHRPHSLFLWWVTLELTGSCLFKRTWAGSWVKTDQRKCNSLILDTDEHQKMYMLKHVTAIPHLAVRWSPWRGDNRACYSTTQIWAGSSYSQPFSTTLNSSVHQNRTQGNHIMHLLSVGALILITILVALHNSLPLHLFGTRVLIQLLCDNNYYENDYNNNYNNDY